MSEDHRMRSRRPDRGASGPRTFRAGAIRGALTLLISFVTVVGLASPIRATPDAPVAPASTNILIALVRWSGNPADASTASTATDVLRYVEGWLESTSRGKVAVTGTVRDWITIAPPSSPCDGEAIRTSSLAALTAAGVNTDAYDEIAVYFGGAAGDACPFSGQSGRPTLVVGRTGVTLWPLRNVVAHEIGHNWGLSHARSLRCVDEGGGAVPLSESCTTSEQGDPFDMMGYASAAGSFNGIKLETLGWLAPGEITEIGRTPGVSTTRTIVVTPLATPGTGGTRLIKVDGIDDHLWSIEVRAAVGVDASMFQSQLPSPTAQGVQVRRARWFWNGLGPTELLDMHPEGPTNVYGAAHHDAALGGGATWTSPDRSLTVTEGASVLAGGARSVTVTTRDRPAAPAAPTAVKGDGRATVSWSAPANGGLAIEGYEVTPFRSGVAQATRTFASTATSQVITGLTPGATYTFKVAARNALGLSPSSAASSAITLDGPFRPFASWDAFVARQLTDFAGSPGTVASRAPAVASLADGSVLPAPYIVQRIEGPWYGPIVGPISRLYWAYFRRTPDVAGVTYWAGRRRAGTSLDTVSQSFAGSAEFKRIYGSLTNRAFVELVYTNVLGRPGEESGMAFWTNQLDTGKRNRGRVMTGFSESSEFKAKRLSDVNTFMAYAGMLGRAPTAAELASATSMSPTQVVEAIRLSTAYAARVS